MVEKRLEGGEMRADRIEYTVYVVQAYGSSGGSQKYWYDIADWAVPGYKRWKNHPQRVGYLGEKFWSDMLVFTERATALEALAHGRVDPCHQIRRYYDLETIDRPKKLRVVERRVLMEQRAVTAPTARLQAADKEAISLVPT